MAQQTDVAVRQVVHHGNEEQFAVKIEACIKNWLDEGLQLHSVVPLRRTGVGFHAAMVIMVKLEEKTNEQ